MKYEYNCRTKIISTVNNMIRLKFELRMYNVPLIGIL